MHVQSLRLQLDQHKPHDELEFVLVSDGTETPLEVVAFRHLPGPGLKLVLVKADD